MAMRWRLCVCSLGILLLVPCSLSEEFSLADFPHPVMGIVGRDMVLRFQFLSPGRLPSMDVQWRKIGSGFILFHEYRNEVTQDLWGAGGSYQTQTELFLQEFSSGNISLKLKWLQVADTGTYHCFLKNTEWIQEATTELLVAAVAPVFIDVLGPRGQGIGLACRSTGWFPKPELQWVGKNRQNLAMEIVTKMSQDRENLYSVVSHVTVTGGEDNEDISCIVWNGLLESEQQSAIHLSRDIFPRVSAWMAAFWVLFALVLIAGGAYAYREYSAKQKAPQKKQSKKEALLNLEIEKTILETECWELREKLDRAVRERGFRRARSYMVPVTLDWTCTYGKLTMSADGRTVWHNPPSQEPAAPSGPLIAVGMEGFLARKDHDKEAGACRVYWEVEVGDSPDWVLGVLSRTVRKKVTCQRMESFPEGGCWVLRRSGGRYHPREADTVIQNWGVMPTVVGVYLDLEGGSVSFYSVNSMALILEIPVEGSEELFPFLSPGHAAGQDQGKPLSICPPSDWDFPLKLGVSGSVIQGDLTAPAQPPAPKNGEGTENDTGPSATAETTPSAAHCPAPGNKQVRENLRKLLPTNLLLKRKQGDKTEQEHPQLETSPKEKGEKKPPNPQV
ncbi:butyrophilin subfamily 3 member A1-like [Emys orbicularis]|uniref:butyrophilin subfamily 3 member A1-like n=1 Tax=Emys orbicularis TaxID=82168 RepID=UPI0031FDDB78